MSLAVFPDQRDAARHTRQGRHETLELRPRRSYELSSFRFLRGLGEHLDYLGIQAPAAFRSGAFQGFVNFLRDFLDRQVHGSIMPPNMVVLWHPPLPGRLRAATEGSGRY